MDYLKFSTVLTFIDVRVSINTLLLYKMTDLTLGELKITWHIPNLCSINRLPKQADLVDDLYDMGYH